MPYEKIQPTQIDLSTKPLIQSVKSALDIAHDELDRVANITCNIHSALIGLDRACEVSGESPSQGIVIDTITMLTEKLRETNDKLHEIN